VNIDAMGLESTTPRNEMGKARGKKEKGNFFIISREPREQKGVFFWGGKGHKGP